MSRLPIICAAVRRDRSHAEGVYRATRKLFAELFTTRADSKNGFAWYADVVTLTTTLAVESGMKWSENIVLIFFLSTHSVA